MACMAAERTGHANLEPRLSAEPMTRSGLEMTGDLEI